MQVTQPLSQAHQRDLLRAVGRFNPASLAPPQTLQTRLKPFGLREVFVITSVLEVPNVEERSLALGWEASPLLNNRSLGCTRSRSLLITRRPESLLATVETWLESDSGTVKEASNRARIWSESILALWSLRRSFTNHQWPRHLFESISVLR